MPQGPGLPTNYGNGRTTYDANEINRLHGYTNTQIPGSIESQGQGVRAARFGDDSFKVTAGTGLQVLVAPGAGTILGTGSTPSAYIERAVQLPLTVPASSTCYIWQGIEQRTAPSRNFTEESGLPLTFQSANPVEPNAIPLATVTTSATAVTSIVDTRGLPIDRVDPEQIRDAIGLALTNSATIAKTVDDAGDTISLSVIDGSITSAKILNGTIVTDDIATGGQFSKEVLEYIAASDISALAVPASTWIDVVPNQTFTIERADNRQVNVFPSGNILINVTGSTGARWGARLLFDSAGTARPLIVGGGYVTPSDFRNILQGTGTPRITGLGAGAHTVKLQIICEQVAQINCRASTVPDYENFKLRVVEAKR